MPTHAPAPRTGPNPADWPAPAGGLASLGPVSSVEVDNRDPALSSSRRTAAPNQYGIYGYESMPAAAPAPMPAAPAAPPAPDLALPSIPYGDDVRTPPAPAPAPAATPSRQYTDGTANPLGTSKPPPGGLDLASYGAAPPGGHDIPGATPPGGMDPLGQSPSGGGLAGLGPEPYDPLRAKRARSSGGRPS